MKKEFLDAEKDKRIRFIDTINHLVMLDALASRELQLEDSEFSSDFFLALARSHMHTVTNAFNDWATAKLNVRVQMLGGLSHNILKHRLMHSYILQLGLFPTELCQEVDRKVQNSTYKNAFTTLGVSQPNSNTKRKYSTFKAKNEKNVNLNPSTISKNVNKSFRPTLDQRKAKEGGKAQGFQYKKSKKKINKPSKPDNQSNQGKKPSNN